MKTKLEMMVGYLAGRQGESAESIRRELRDPAGEASRWLEEVQLRSRDILDGGLLKSRGLDLHPYLRKGIVVQRPGRRRWLTVLLGASAMTLAFVGLAATWRVQGEQLLRLETMLRRREAQWGDRFNHLDAILARRQREVPGMPTASKEPATREAIPSDPPEKPPDLALARIEARLAELGRRLEEVAPRQSQGDPSVDQLRRDVEQLGQQAEVRARLSRQEFQSLSMVLQEVLQALTRLALTSRGSEPMQVPVPVPVFPEGHTPGLGQGPGMLPGPGQGQTPGQGPSGIDPGHDNRGRGPRNYPDGRTNPRR
jgi:hypothetical protein